MPPSIQLLEPTLIIALLTAELYFWGYAYYSAFCEHLDIHLDGLEISFRDYLVVRWNNVFSLGLGIACFTIILAVLILLEPILFKLVEAMLTRIIRKIKNSSPKFSSCYGRIMGKLRAHFESEGESNSKWAFKLVNSAYVIFCILFVSIYFANESANQGKASAQEAIDNKRQVIIRQRSDNELQGNFYYLHDFGGTLIVHEQSEDRKATGIRILKTGSYSSYTLIRSTLDQAEDSVQASSTSNETDNTPTSQPKA